jgi:hypothetical protein
MRLLQFCLQQFRSVSTGPNQSQSTTGPRIQIGTNLVVQLVNLSVGKTLDETTATFSCSQTPPEKTGWAAWMGQLEDYRIWSQQLQSLHINYQELTAIWRELQRFPLHI